MDICKIEELSAEQEKNICELENELQRLQTEQSKQEGELHQGNYIKELQN